MTPSQWAFCPCEERGHLPIPVGYMQPHCESLDLGHPGK